MKLVNGRYFMICYSLLEQGIKYFKDGVLDIEDYYKIIDEDLYMFNQIIIFNNDDKIKEKCLDCICDYLL